MATSAWIWWIMPGGVIRRAARWWDPAWQIAPIRRDDSVCCIIQDAIGDGWEAQIWCGRNYRLTFIGKDATHFLRAWLSPVPTPQADALGDMR